jgi:hypothetical protein
MTTESKKPSDRKPSDRYAEWPQNATPLDVNAMAFLDEHHARLTALEAAMDTLTRHEAEALRPAIRERFPVKAAAPSPQPSRSVEDEAREFYCQRHEGVRLRDVADWMVRDMIDFANQRTAAVERERDNLKWMLDLTNGNLTKADRERDEWKAKFEKLGARWNSDHAAVYAELSAARSERDAALAKVAELEKVLAAVRGVVK